MKVFEVAYYDNFLSHLCGSEGGFKSEGSFLSHLCGGEVAR